MINPNVANDIRMLSLEERRVKVEELCGIVILQGNEDVFMQTVKRYSVDVYRKSLVLSFEGNKTYLKVEKSMESLVLDVNTMQAYYRCCGTKSSESVAEVIIEAMEVLQAMEV